MAIEGENGTIDRNDIIPLLAGIRDIPILHTPPDQVSETLNFPERFLKIPGGVSSNIQVQTDFPQQAKDTIVFRSRALKVVGDLGS